MNFDEIKYPIGKFKPNKSTFDTNYIKENIEILNSLNVEESLMNFNFLNKSMLVKLAQNEIKNLDDFAGLTTDDLLGYYEDRHDKNSKVQGILEEFNLTKDEGDQLILEARKIWLDK